MVEHEAIHQATVVLRHRARAGRHAEFRHHLGGRPLDRMPADDRRHSDHRRAAGGDRGAHARHGKDRIDADERVRRADHHRLEAIVFERFAECRRRARIAGALKFESFHSRCTPLLHEIALKGQDAVLGAHQRADRFVAHRKQPGADTQTPAEIVADRAQAFAGGEAARALDVRRQVGVAETEPGLAAQLLQRPHEAPGLARAPPAGLGVGDPGQRVQDRVQIRRDAEPQMLEVVAGVAHHHQAIRRQRPVQAERQLGAADAAGQGDHPDRRAHRNRSASRARSSAAAGAGGPCHASPRTSTAGRPSSASPISSCAAEAISSARPT